MRPLEAVFKALARSPFRRRFRLRDKERSYLAAKGMPAILGHGRDFIAARLAPALPANDGRQTPMRGHPVFVAQHATATCCRACLAKWHRIEAGRPLSPEERAQVLRAVELWLEDQAERRDAPA